MPDTLNGKKIAIIATDGVEQVELVKPRDAVQDAGATTELLSVQSGEIQAMNSDIEPADKFPVDKEIGDASPDDYDGLILPGGTVNADRLRMDENVISFVQKFFADAKPVGVICHGPWTLVEADLSYPSLRTDIRNAGGEAVDEEVVVDQGLVSSRNPDDLPGFLRQDRRGVRRGRAPDGPRRRDRSRLRRRSGRAPTATARRRRLAPGSGGAPAPRSPPPRRRPTAAHSVRSRRDFDRRGGAAGSRRPRARHRPSRPRRAAADGDSDGCRDDTRPGHRARRAAGRRSAPRPRPRSRPETPPTPAASAGRRIHRRAAGRNPPAAARAG